MLAVKLSTSIVPVVHSASKAVFPIFQNDIVFLNKIHKIYVNIYNSITTSWSKMFFETIPMGYIYLIIIGYIAAPLLGKLIGLLINRLTGNKVVRGA